MDNLIIMYTFFNSVSAMKLFLLIFAGLLLLLLLVVCIVIPVMYINAQKERDKLIDKMIAERTKRILHGTKSRKYHFIR